MGTKHICDGYGTTIKAAFASRIISHAERYKLIAQQVRSARCSRAAGVYSDEVADGLEGIRKHVFQAEMALAKLLDCPPEHRDLAGADPAMAAEDPEPYITPVGKNAPIPTPTRKKAFSVHSSDDQGTYSLARSSAGGSSSTSVQRKSTTQPANSASVSTDLMTSCRGTSFHVRSTTLLRTVNGSITLSPTGLSWTSVSSIFACLQTIYASWQANSEAHRSTVSTPPGEA